jgi:uncharacterized protein with PIN domain
MTLYLDASALVAAHLDTPARQVVLDAMAADPDWCSSGLTLMESLALIDRVLDQPVLRSDLEDLVRLTWDRVAIVPVDQRCLDRAATLPPTASRARCSSSPSTPARSPWPCRSASTS